MLGLNLFIGLLAVVIKYFEYLLRTVVHMLLNRVTHRCRRRRKCGFKSRAMYIYLYTGYGDEKAEKLVYSCVYELFTTNHDHLNIACMFIFFQCELIVATHRYLIYVNTVKKYEQNPGCKNCTYFITLKAYSLRN